MASPSVSGSANSFSNSHCFCLAKLIIGSACRMRLVDFSNSPSLFRIQPMERKPVMLTAAAPGPMNAFGGRRKANSSRSSRSEWRKSSFFVTLSSKSAMISEVSTLEIDMPLGRSLANAVLT